MWPSAVLVLALAGAGLTGCSASPGTDDSRPEGSATPTPSPSQSQEPSGAPLPDVTPEPPATPGNGSVSPESFGARGDGRTDDTAALQRAVDTAASQDAAVELGADRTYLLSRALELPDGAHLSGSGPSSRLRFTWRFNDDEHDGFYLGNRDQDAGNQDITLADFAIVGAGTGLPAGPNELHQEPRVPAVRLRLVDRFRIEGLDIGRAPGISIIHQGCSNGVIADNRIHDSGRDGINGTWHVRNMREILIEDNVITRVGDDAIAVIGTPGNLPNRDVLPLDILVRHNVIRGWESDRNGLLLGRGITVMAARRVGIVGNIVDRTDSAGILVAPSTRPFSRNPATGEPWRSADVSIVDNEIRDAGQNYDGPGAPESSGRDGVLVKQSDRVWAVGNTITNPYGRTIAFYDCRSCVGGDAA